MLSELVKITAPKIKNKSELINVVKLEYSLISIFHYFFLYTHRHELMVPIKKIFSKNQNSMHFLL